MLGHILIRPLFQKERRETVIAANVERVLASTPKKGKTVYHVFQSRDGGMCEVHVFSAGSGTDESALDRVFVDLLGIERFKRA